MNAARLFRATFLWVMAAGVLVPFAIVAGVSFNPARRIAFPPESLSLRWYAELLTASDWHAAIWNSLSIALVAAALATLIATCAAYALWRQSNWLNRSVFGLGVGPYMVPPVILALGASIFWAEVGLYGSRWATAISHGVLFVTLPLVIIARGFSHVGHDEHSIGAGAALERSGRER